MSKNPVVHFEMPYKDSKKVAEFYSQAFGWEMQQMDAKYGEYILAMTDKSDEKGPLERGRINGGFFKLDNDKPGQYPSVVVEVEDIKIAMQRVKDAGGEVLGEPWDIPGVGMYVSFNDSEGNRVGMMQPSSK